MRPTRRTATPFGTLLGLLAAAAGACLVLPGVAGAQAPAQDSVTGTSFLYFSPTDLFSTSTTTLDARSGPAGENPTGTFTAHFGGGLGPTYTGSVTCLAVNGNRAVIGVEGTRNFFGSTEPFSGTIVVTDGGSTVTQPPWPDTFSFAEFLPPVPTNCSLTPPPATFFFAASDITVTDVQPLPTSKEQCKNGGWRDFGDMFKNQGQCVAFVQRGPKP
jgi:hypothetical protein